MNLGEVYVLEDDAAVRETLSVILANAGYKAICFADGNALMACARKKYPICILVDLKLPGKSGMEILSELQAENYPAPAIMISGQGNIEIAVQALHRGAADFIEKPFRANELVARIEKAIAKTKASRTPSGRPQVRLGNLEGWQVLTAREQQILRELLLGKSSKDIARQIGLSPRTVEDHRSRILKKARVKNIAQLMLSVLQPIPETRPETDES